MITRFGLTCSFVKWLYCSSGKDPTVEQIIPLARAPEGIAIYCSRLAVVVPNKIQSFLINYEIKKLIDKAVNVRNRKYSRIIYINSNISPNTILNTLDFLIGAYPEVVFDPSLIDLDGDLENIPNIKTIKKGNNFK